LLHFTRQAPDEVEVGIVRSTRDWGTSTYWRGVVLGRVPEGCRGFLVSNGETTEFASPFQDDSAAGQDALLQYLREYNLELFRSAEFPDLPSRRKCLFLLNTKVDPTEFARSMQFDLTGISLLEVELLDDTPCHHIASINHLNGIPLGGDLVSCAGGFRRYWLGTTIDDPTAEVLYEGAYKILSVVKRAPLQ
jgi:hypothetical protein